MLMDKACNRIDFMRHLSKFFVFVQIVFYGNLERVQKIAKSGEHEQIGILFLVSLHCGDFVQHLEQFDLVFRGEPDHRIFLIEHGQHPAYAVGEAMVLRQGKRDDQSADRFAVKID